MSPRRDRNSETKSSIPQALPHFLAASSLERITFDQGVASGGDSHESFFSQRASNSPRALLRSACPIRVWNGIFAAGDRRAESAGFQLRQETPARHGPSVMWKAVKAAGTKDTEAVTKKLKELPVDDAFAQGKVLENGRMVHDLYLFEVRDARRQNVCLGPK